jgi:PAS domain S-box-containing protein
MNEQGTLDELKRRALDAVDAGVIIAEAAADTPTVFANEGFERITGYDADEMLGRNCRILQGEGTDDRPVESMRTAVAEGKPTSVVLRNYRKDGTEFWNEVELTPVHDEDGAVTHVLGFQRDVTERKRLQAENEAAQRSLRRLYTVTTDAALSLGERIERTLAVGCRRLGVDLGFVTRIEDGTQNIVHAVGDHPQLQVGAACPLSESYCRRTLDEEGLLAVVHAATEEGWTDDPGYERFGLECYIGGKLVVDGDLYGTLCFADVKPRGEPFTGSQAAFVELLSRWVGYEFERDRRERELRVADRRFRSLFENPMTFVGVLDPDGTLREANDTALSVLADEPEAVLDHPFWEAPWWTPDDDSVATVRDAVETAADGQAVQFECDYFFEGGRGTVGAMLYPVYADESVDADAVGADDGNRAGTEEAENGTEAGAEPESETETETEMVSLMAVGADTTTRTEQAAELKRQRDRLEEFASVVSHDLRSPLEVARGRLRLHDSTGDPEHLDAVDDSLDRMSALIDDLLELARQGAAVSDLEPTPVTATAGRAWSTVDTAGAAYEAELDGDATVDADPSRLQQLFENLFRNSVEHGSTGPRSRARTDGVEHGPTGEPRNEHVTVRLTGLGGETRGFAVEDDGSGIPAEDREHVFERGFSTDDDGTGFGLAIVRRVAEAHGWDVRATESDTGGARVEVHVDGPSWEY